MRLLRAGPPAVLRADRTLGSRDRERLGLRPVQIVTRLLEEQIDARAFCEEAGCPERRERTAVPFDKHSPTGEAWPYVAWTWEGLR